MDLHALLDDCLSMRKRNQSKPYLGLPSNGFIKASLAIVAEAPLVALTFSVILHKDASGVRKLTSNERMVFLVHVTT